MANLHAFYFSALIALLFNASLAAKPYRYHVRRSSAPTIDSQTACNNLFTKVPAALANLPRSSHSQPLNLTNVITKLYAYGDNPSTTDLLNDIPAAALGDMAGITMAQVASSLGDWDRYALMFDQGYGLEDETQQQQGGLPAFCRFGASIVTSNTSQTWFEAWMPVPNNGTEVRLANTTSTTTNSTGNYTNSQLVQNNDGQLVRPDVVNNQTVVISNSTNATVPLNNNTNVNGGASRSEWQGRLVFLGSSAQRGAPSYPEMKQILARYREATASSNLGHFGTGGSANWTVGQPEAQLDFGYRGTHAAAVAAEHVVKIFYHTSSRHQRHNKRNERGSNRAITSHGVELHERGHDDGFSPQYGFPTYFKGCSTGGRQAIVEAQRFPRDFDGIIAGSPAIYYNELNAYQIHVNHFQANSSSPAYIPQKLYSVIHDFVLKECDTIDGLNDAVIEDPSKCKPRFDLLQCAPPLSSSNLTGLTNGTSALLGDLLKRKAEDRTGNQTSSVSFTSSTATARSSDISSTRTTAAMRAASSSTTSSNATSTANSTASASASPTYAPSGKCLTSEQIANLRNIYSPYTYPDGKIIHEPVLYGSETTWPVTDGVVGTAFPPAPGWFQYQVLNQTGEPSDFDYFNVVDNNFTLIRQGKRLNPGQTESSNPNLSTFFNKGGKLIHYHGLADQLIPSGASDRFHDHVRSRTGVGLASYRYFHIPGMGHCRGGDGPWNFGGAGQTDDGSRPLKFETNYDMLLAMFEWVERGNAPKKQWGANYKITTGPERKNYTTSYKDDQEYSNGVKHTHRLCSYPRTVAVTNNSTSTQHCRSP